MKASEVLKKALAKIEQGWVQGVFARDKDGKPTDYASDEACVWCASGAIKAVNGGVFLDAAAVFLERVIPRGYVDVPDWNDAPERTQAEVIEAFKKAIALAEAEGQ